MFQANFKLWQRKLFRYHISNCHPLSEDNCAYLWLRWPRRFKKFLIRGMIIKSKPERKKANLTYLLPLNQQEKKIAFLSKLMLLSSIFLFEILLMNKFQQSFRIISIGSDRSYWLPIKTAVNSLLEKGRLIHHLNRPFNLNSLSFSWVPWNL